MSHDGELDALYASPLADFVGRRNELAKRLRAGGDRDAADRVQALPKPSLPAWVVNQLAFRAPEELAALMAAGAEVRAAHLAAAPERQAASRARREALEALLGRAEEIVGEGGGSLSRAHRQRVSRTLETLSSRGPESDGPVAGRLGEDLEPAGFDALGDLAAALEQARADRAAEPVDLPSKPPSKPVAAAPETSKAERRAEAEARRRETVRRALDRQLEEADETLARLEEKIAVLGGDAENAAAELEEAKGAAAELVAAALEAERRAREARRSADAAGERAQRARFASESAAAALERARKAREEAREKRDRLAAERQKL